MRFFKVIPFMITGVKQKMQVSRSICCGSPSISINGFGRIGKALLRQSFKKNIQVVAVNQPLHDIYAIAKSLKFDTTHGFFDQEVKVFNQNTLCVGGRPVHVFHENNPETIKWKDFPADCVVDATGIYTKMDDAKKHLKAGAKNVIITAPSQDAPMFVKGVNFAGYNKTMQVVSNASCTTNCAAPLIKALDVKYGLVSCMFTTAHAMTSSQPVHDNLKNRSGTQNIVPSKTGAAKAVDVVLPNLKDKVKGDAIRVPVLDVSLLKLYINVKGGDVTKDNVKAEIKRLASAELKDVIYYVDESCVSSDFIGSQYSAVVDLRQIQVIGKMIGLGVWYDNEVGYACRVLDLVQHMANQDAKN